MTTTGCSLLRRHTAALEEAASVLQSSHVTIAATVDCDDEGTEDDILDISSDTARVTTKPPPTSSSGVVIGGRRGEQDALLAAAKRRAEEKRRVVGNAMPPSASAEETKERTNFSSASSSSSCDYNKMDWFNLLGVVTNPTSTSTSSYYDQYQYSFNNGGMGSMHGRRLNCTSGRSGVQVSSRYGASISLDHVGSGDFDWISANG